jgi:hypothetical protein
VTNVLPALIIGVLFLTAGCTDSHSVSADTSPSVSTASETAASPAPLTAGASPILPELPQDPAALSASGALGISLPASAWKVATSRNGSVEENLISSLSDSRRVRLIVRQFGKKLEVYLSTGDVPDVVDTPSKDRSLVKYKFDEGEPAQEKWLVSRHKFALLFPGDPVEFLGKIRKARRLDVDLSMAADSLDTESFNLALFPEGALGAMEKNQ